MAQIQLTNVLTGQTKAFPLAVLDFNAYLQLASMPSAQPVYAPTVTDTHKNWYMLDQDANAALCLSGVITADSDKNLFYIGPEPYYLDNFLQESSSTYLPDYTGETVTWFWKQPTQDTKGLTMGGTFVPNQLYFKSETACALYQTANGGTIGGCIGTALVGGDSMAVANVGANQTSWTGGFYQVNTNHDYNPKFDGSFILDCTNIFRNWPNTAVAETWTEENGKYKTPSAMVTQCVYTEISGYPYIGMAAIKLDALGVPSAISVNFIPAWFWGDFSQPEDPEDAPQYYGIDSGISGGDGTYTEGNTAPPLGSDLQPFASVSKDGYGLHVYKINSSEYDLVQAALWGGNGLSVGALWDKWKNYKFNPVASFISCHCLPDCFIPTITPTVLSQLRAGGTHIVSSATVPYLNSKTTVTTSFPYKAIGKFFSNHLAYTPYSHYQLYLPFCGVLDIPADRIRGGGIQVHYRCDIITGNVCAYVDCVDQDGALNCQYTLTGNCALNIPITGNDNGTGQAVGAISGLALGALTGNPAAFAAGVAGAALSISGAQHTTQTAGQYSGSVAAIGQLSIILTVTQPVQQDTERARDLRGIVSYVDATLADMEGTGFTQIAEVKADISGATDEEKQDIERILREGVFL